MWCIDDRRELFLDAESSMGGGIDEREGFRADFAETGV